MSWIPSEAVQGLTKLPFLSGLAHYDVPTVDAIVARLDQDGGRCSTLLFGVLESAPFQLRRVAPNAASQTPKAAGLTLNSSVP